MGEDLEIPGVVWEEIRLWTEEIYKDRGGQRESIQVPIIDPSIRRGSHPHKNALVIPPNVQCGSESRCMTSGVSMIQSTIIGKYCALIGQCRERDIDVWGEDSG